MKVLCLHTPCGPHYVRSGWGRAFAACGHDFRFWQPASKSAFDAFSEFEPELFIGTTYDLDRALCKCIRARPALRVILFGSAWGELVDGLDRDRYPLVVATAQEQASLERLKGETGRPDFVFIHVTDKYLEGTMGGWRTIGIEPVGILNAADTFVYLDGEYRHELRCDVAFVGGYWPYKARNLDRFLLPLCHDGTARPLDVKIFGNQNWPVAQYLGTIADEDVRHLFRSAVVCPNVSEPHSTDLGWDIVERPFKVMASGGFCISDWVDEARQLFDEEELPMARTPRELQQLVRKFVLQPEARQPHIDAGRRKVLRQHTYFDRIQQMFDRLGLAREAARVLAVKAEHLAGKL